MANCAADNGTKTLRELEGTCDWCGDECYPSAECCVLLSCCRCDDSGMYHQGCLEKFLKQYGFPSSRKIGFPCPRGRGKGTKSAKECLGRIDRSHAIIPRNEEKKRRAMPPPLADVVGKQGGKQPITSQQTPQAQRGCKPGGVPARRLTHPKAYESLSQTTSMLCNSTVDVKSSSGPSYFVDMDHQGEQPRPAHIPVGLVLEEALTKAQRKNLARRKKKQEAATVGSEASNEAIDKGAEGHGSMSQESLASKHESHVVAFDELQGNLLVGHNKFVTDPARYLQLVGMLSDNSDDEAGVGSDDGDQVDADHLESLLMDGDGPIGVGDADAQGSMLAALGNLAPGVDLLAMNTNNLVIAESDASCHQATSTHGHKSNVPWGQDDRESVVGSAGPLMPHSPTPLGASLCLAQPLHIMPTSSHACNGSIVASQIPWGHVPPILSSNPCDVGHTPHSVGHVACPEGLHLNLNSEGSVLSNQNTLAVQKAGCMESFASQLEGDLINVYELLQPKFGHAGPCSNNKQYANDVAADGHIEAFATKIDSDDELSDLLALCGVTG